MMVSPPHRVMFTGGWQLCTPFGTLHAGALAAVFELAAYLAALPGLGETQHAVTHAIAAQFVAPALEGEDVTVVGRVVRRTRSAVFLAANATVQGRTVAEAQITKSIIELCPAS